MKIAEIGTLFHQDYVDRIKYFSDDFFLDSDILVIDLEAIHAELISMGEGEPNGSYWFTYDQHLYFSFIIEARKKQLSDYFNGGGNLWIKMPKCTTLTFEFQTAHNDFQDIQIDLLNLVTLDSKDFTMESRKGSNIVFYDTVLGSFFNLFRCKYEFSFSKFKGMAIAHINKTKLPVGVIISKAKGNIILMPSITIDVDSYEDFENFNHHICKDFEKIDSELKSRYKNTPDLPVPDWCNSYYLSNEPAHLKRLDKLYEDRDQISKLIQQQQQVISEYNSLKQLLFTSSSILEQRVRNIFSEFGYNLLFTEENRDDLIISHKTDVAVIEVKGQKGSGTEANAAQLMKWVSTYHHDHRILPKGILIVNAFKDIPLAKRTDHPFPTQMQPYSQKMGLTLMTTVQLLGLYLDFKTGDINFKRLHQLLWHTIGVLEYIPTKIIKS